MIVTALLCSNPRPFLISSQISASPAQDKVSRFRLWLQDLSHKECNVTLQRFPKGSQAPGYGMVAGPGGVQKGSPLVTVPREALLTEETAANCPCIGPLLQKSELTSWQGMCLHLLYERACGLDSFWNPYISLLPSELDMAGGHPLLWPERTRKEWLAGSPMLNVIDQRLQRCREDYEALLSAGTSNLVSAGTRSKGFITEASVRWAAAILLSRAFSLELDEEISESDGPSISLVPWADMLNHSSSAGHESCLAYDEELKVASLYAHKSYVEGEQVYDSYGPALTGPQLFLDYGFVDDDNHNHAIDLPTTALGPLKSEANASLLQAIGLSIGSSVFSLTPSGVDESVLAWTRAAIASQQELEKAGWTGVTRSVEEASSAMVFFSSYVSRENESEVLRRLILACQELSNRYPTSLEEDQALLGGGTFGDSVVGPLPWARQQVLKALVSEKLALRGAYEALWKTAKDLKSAEIDQLLACVTL